MTAKHRKGKSSNKHEENSFKHDVPELEERSGNHYTLLFLLFLIVIIGGATIGWFCFQQHQALSQLTDNLMGMQMKMVRLQSHQEELRKSSDKQGLEGLEQRVNTLEESYALAQKQVGMALATAEQLKTSDLPAQVLALQTEMKARLAEVQQAAVSSDQLAQLSEALGKQGQEFEAVKQQVEGLAGSSAELAQSVEGLQGSLAASEARLDDRAAAIGTLGAQLEDQAAKLQGLNDLLATQQSQVESSTQEIAEVKTLLEAEAAKQSQQAEVEEQLSSMRQSIQDHNGATQDLYSDLSAKLKAIQEQVAQLEGSSAPETAPVEAEVAEAAPEVEATAEAAVDAVVAALEALDEGAPVETVEEGAAAAAEEDNALLEAEEEEAPQGEEAGEEAPSIEESVTEEVVEEESAPAADEVEEAEEDLEEAEPMAVEEEPEGEPPAEE